MCGTYLVVLITMVCSDANRRAKKIAHLGGFLIPLRPSTGRVLTFAIMSGLDEAVSILVSFLFVSKPRTARRRDTTVSQSSMGQMLDLPDEKRQSKNCQNCRGSHLQGTIVCSFRF